MLKYALSAAILVSTVSMAAAQQDVGPPRWAANLVRKQLVIMNGVPRPYTNMHDPLADSAAKLRRGRMIFDRDCSGCHGWSGEGNGPDAFAQVPAPADLEWLAHTPKGRAEPYMYWAVAEGGQSFQSEMPPFKGRLNQKDIWAVIAYVRAGLPGRSP
jgi:mono/diheme cytochrome c family protein